MAFSLRAAPVLLACLGLFGCAHTPKSGAVSSGAEPSPTLVQTLGPGDVIKISFPGAPNLETTQQIRRDGKVNLSLIGEVAAAEKTPIELENELVRMFAAHVISKEIKVTVVSSSFAVFVTGAVLKPGKLAPDRMITAFEAIMEAGGFDLARANTKEVRVIRHEGGKMESFTLNLKSVLDGKAAEPFYLRSHDIIFVPEKFSWF